MKYTIIINQLALQQIASNLDLIDASILDYLIHFCRADEAKTARITLEERGRSESYTWINYAQLIRELPILKIKTKGAISRRIIRIEEAGFIKITREPNKPRAGRLFVRLTEKIKLLFFERRVVLEQPQGLPQNNAGLPQNNIQHSNNKHSIEPSAKAKKGSLVHQVFDFFSGACEEIKRFKPRISGEIEGGMVKKYLQDYSVEELTDELDWFLRSKESEKLGCTIKIGLSVYVFNKWLAQRAS